MILKPQDVVVLLKLVALGAQPWTFQRLAVELSLSQSEAHAGDKRGVPTGYAAPELQTFVAGTFKRLLADGRFVNALPGLVMQGSPADRTPIVLQRLRAMAQMHIQA